MWRWYNKNNLTHLLEHHQYNLEEVASIDPVFQKPVPNALFCFVTTLKVFGIALDKIVYGTFESLSICLLFFSARHQGIVQYVLYE